jgi:hypothetical protein
VLLASAKVDALIHTARGECEPAIPLVQPETIEALSPPAILTMACPAGCGAVLAAQIAIGDRLSVTVAAGEPCARFTAEAPDLGVVIYEHLRVCPCAHGWVDAAFEATRTAG